jgi:hypothetical protein
MTGDYNVWLVLTGENMRNGRKKTFPFGILYTIVFTWNILDSNWFDVSYFRVSIFCISLCGLLSRFLGAIEFVSVL